MRLKHLRCPARPLMISARSVLVSILGGLYVLSAHANNEDSVPIIVTATRNQDNTRAQIIDAEQIRQSPAATLPELLSLEAGIFSRSLYGNNAARATVDIRGFGATAAQNTLILLDGRRLNDVDLAAIDFSAIPLADIERVEITRGGGGVLYGDGAVGGTINIITKQPATLGNTGHIELAAGSYGDRSINIAANHGSGIVFYNLLANGIHSDGYRDNNVLDQKNIQFNLSVAQSESEAYFKIGYNDQDIGLPGERTVDPSIGLDELHQDPRGTNNPNDYADQNGYFVTAGVMQFIGADTEMIIDLGVRNKTQKAFFGDYDFAGAFASYLDTNLTTTSLTPRIKTSHTLFNLPATSILGVDIYNSNYDSDRSLNPDTIDDPIHRLGITQKSASVYGRNATQLNANNEVTLGARFQSVKLTANDQFNSAAPGAGFESGAAALDQTDKANILEFSLHHRQTDATVITASVQRSARFATVDEIFELDPTSFLRVFSPLEPQVSRNIELGIDYTQAAYQLTSSIYYMTLENEIYFDPVTFTNVNLDPTLRKGLEVSFTYRIAAAVRVNGQYAYTRAEFRDGSFKGNNVPLVPMNSASLSASWDLSPTLQFIMTASHVGEKYFDNDQANNFMRIPSFDLVDVKLLNENGPWKFTGTINNLFDQETYDYGVISTITPGRYNAYPLPERNVSFAVIRDFN